jgi:hypothetical protein
VSPAPCALVHSGNADRDREFPREEAEAERELLVEMEATEIKHREAVEVEARVMWETLRQLIVESAAIVPVAWETLRQLIVESAAIVPIALVTHVGVLLAEIASPVALIPLVTHVGVLLAEIAPPVALVPLVTALRVQLAEIAPPVV